MESKELPTIKKFQDEYAKRVGHHNWTEFVTFESKGTVIQENKIMMHEYAILFAQHHVTKAIDTINDEMWDECKCINITAEERDRLISVVKNAYPLSEIK